MLTRRDGDCQMSQNFVVGEQMVWNPSNGPGQLFVRSADALAPVAGLPTGIRQAHPGDPDEWAIDMPVFEAFVDALVDRYQWSAHLVMRSLMEGCAAALLEVSRSSAATSGAPGAPATAVRRPGCGVPSGRLRRHRAHRPGPGADGDADECLGSLSNFPGLGRDAADSVLPALAETGL